MKISVKKAQNGVYSVAFDDATHTLTTRDLKILLLEAVKSLTPGAISCVSPTQEAFDLATRLKAANNPGLQKLIMSVTDDDILIFLKSTQSDVQLHTKLFDNMSERKHKMLAEDLEYRFADGIDDGLLGEAVIRLIELTNQLQNDGVLEIDQRKRPDPQN
ncbi:MAG: hypothetical protein JKY27_02630 [Magnetovibrio sp.]|nr:hypothetical protein [Magnetovibrio sp.]